MKIKIGSRKSRLAMWQTHRVKEQLEEVHGDLDIEIVTMVTTGDQRADEPLPSIGAKGLFTAELESALLEDEIDLAVHSLKDLPSQLPEGLKYAGSPRRGAATDALVSTRWNHLDELPHGATVATGSQRRRAQLLHRRPDLEMANLRGNIGTRLNKLDAKGFDAIVMATAALERLEMKQRITMELQPPQFVPAIGQGAIGIETREGRLDVDALLAPIFDETTVEAVTAERCFMRLLEGGCSVALGAYCRHIDDGWTFYGWASSTDGQQVLFDERKGTDPVALGDEMARDFIERGAREILDT